jgi:hypothetical protein
VEQIIQIHMEDFTLVNFEKKPESLDGGSWAPSSNDEINQPVF